MKIKKSSQCPRKTKDKVEELIKLFFKTHHQVDLKLLHGIGQQIVTVVVDDLESPLKSSKKIHKFLSTWFKTTNIKGNMEDHSAHGFCDFMENHYDFIILEKSDSWKRKVLLRLLKFCK